MELTERELSEIKLALFYEKECNHGTAGHNRLVLIAKMATELGIELDFCEDEEVTDEHKRKELHSGAKVRLGSQC